MHKRKCKEITLKEQDSLNLVRKKFKIFSSTLTSSKQLIWAASGPPLVRIEPKKYEGELKPNQLAISQFFWNLNQFVPLKVRKNSTCLMPLFQSFAE